MGKNFIINGADFSQNGMYNPWEDCSNLLVFNQKKYFGGATNTKEKAGDGMYDYYIVTDVFPPNLIDSTNFILSNPVDVSDTTKIKVTICTSTTTTFGNSLVILDSNDNIIRRIVANEHSYKGTMLALIDLPIGSDTIQFATWDPNVPEGEYATDVKLYKFR